MREPVARTGEPIVNIAWLLLGLHTILGVTSMLHALLYKKEPRAALGWIAVCFAYPLIGPLLYFLFGINRVKTRAHHLKGQRHPGLFNYERSSYENLDPYDPEHSSIPQTLAGDSTLFGLARASAAINHHPLLENNSLTPYFSAENAYKDMLESIHQAQISICLTSYIFETNQTGRAFIEALSTAKNRGVDVRVLLDGIGAYYSFPTAAHLLIKKGVNVIRFTPPQLYPPAFYINLRNHRKLLIVDGSTGFTGGMNIGDRQLRQRPDGRQGINDMHFKLQGPTVAELQRVFEEDWAFAKGKPVKTESVTTTPKLPGDGSAICRVITDGPNEDIGKLLMTLSGAIALARQRIAIMTPYFLPPPVLINALQSAALRGVNVSIILPAQSNQKLAHWATRNMLWELLQYDVHIYYQPPPFAHSKFLLIDRQYAQIGSANMDPRSLRLNFELIVEVFDASFVEKLAEHFDATRALSRQESLSGVDQRPFLTRIRDAIAWLFSPYL